MKQTFETLQSLVDYMPNCLICHKPLRFVFAGPKYRIKLKIQDSKLIPTDRKKLFNIDIVNNLIDDKTNIIKHHTHTNLIKTCKTCCFTIETIAYFSENIKKFDTLRFKTLYISYTDKPNIKIYCLFSKNFENLCYLYINDRAMNNNSSIIIDIDKIINFNQLKNTIRTILTFQ